MSISDPLATLDQRLAAQADPQRAVVMAAYMRDQFAFWGIQAPQLRALNRDFVRQAAGPGRRVDHALVHALWARPQREYQYTALDLLDYHKAHATPADLDLYEALVQQKSWWDTVDLLAGKLVGSLLRRYPDAVQRTEAWIASDHLWLQRTALLYQLSYKQHTDWPRLQAYILRHRHSDAFFIQKAMGWALRSYSRIDPAAVRAFAGAHDLPALTRREGLKYC